MKLWMSGEVDLDVSDSYREARNAVEARINEKLSRITIEPSFDKWAFIGIIRKEDHPDYVEISKKDVRKRVLEFRLKINHDEFKNADPGKEQMMIMDALDRSLDLMTELSVPTSDRDALRSILTDVRSRI